MTTTTMNTLGTLPVVQRAGATPFDRFLNDFVNRAWRENGEGVGTYKPAVDAFETAHGIHFLVDLPGLKKDDLEVTWENGVLTISGERQPEWSSEGSGFHRVERFHGKFSRSFSLPQGVDLEKIDAAFEDGVLRLQVPKGDQLRARKVEIR